MENSLDQVNRDNQHWKDRHDVEKAWAEWKKLKEEKARFAFPKEAGLVITRSEAFEFATFFAERVKGAPVAVKPVVQARRCDHCGYAYYPQHSEAEKNEYFCCAACENGY
jgi:formylmethanofuran dehydrogenase subunit E